MKTIDNKQMYFLALQRMPGDYKFIDISKLNISRGFNSCLLEEIDSFTMCFSIEEIMSSIIEANIVEPAYQAGTLVIQDNQKHSPLKVIDKTYLSDFNIELFLKKHLNNKSLMNNIAYKLSAIIMDEEISANFKNAILSGNVQLAINIIFQIEYNVQRKFMIYLIDLYHKELEKKKPSQELIRDKAA